MMSIVEKVLSFFKNWAVTDLFAMNLDTVQCGITCGAIKESSRSSTAIDERIIINFRDENVLIVRFRDKCNVFIFMTKCHDIS